MTIHRYLNSAHQYLARSAWATRGAILLRNQCGQVIRYRLGPSDHMDQNGERLLLDSVVASCRTIIDVGANLGSWTDAVLSYPGGENKHVLAFEPQQSCLEHLNDRFRSKGNVEIVQAAVGNEVGELTLFESKNSEHSSLVPLDDAGDNKGVQSVAVTTLDHEVTARGWNGVDLVKIDAEGYDMRVLEGASELLRAQKIGCVQFEYNRSWAQAASTLAGAYGILERNQYRVFLLQPTGLFDLDYNSYGEYFGYSNFVAFSPTRSGDLQHLLRGTI